MYLIKRSLFVFIVFVGFIFGERQFFGQFNINNVVQNELYAKENSEEYLVFLPIVIVPLSVNTTIDAIDVNPGDGVCQTSVGTCSLRAAIQETNASPHLNSIILPAGNYILTLTGQNEDSAQSGDLDITEELSIIGSGADVTIIDGNKIDRVIHILGASTHISDLTITNGSIENSSDHGGGIYNGRDSDYIVGNLVVEDANILDNFAMSRGGGIYSDGRLSISNSTIANNEAYSNGGGINSATTHIQNSNIQGNISHWRGGGINATQLTIINSTVTHNSVENSYTDVVGGGIAISSDSQIESVEISHNSVTPGGGGGIYFKNPSAKLTISNSKINNNQANGNGTATKGGGLYSEGKITINNSLFQDNRSIYDGGAIYYDYDSSSDLLELKQVAIIGNSANYSGGGINSFGSPIKLTNVTLSNNSAYLGGGLHSGGGPVKIINSTIYDNHAYGGNEAGGGIENYNGVIQLKNTIVANNIPLNCGRTNVTSLGNNLENRDDCHLNATGDMKHTNPELGPLQNNGGFTPTHALLSGSLGIDNGTNSECPTMDQRGKIRPIDGNNDSIAICDIGSFEYP
jgi:CSLREA domain-containing protein